MKGLQLDQEMQVKQLLIRYSFSQRCPIIFLSSSAGSGGEFEDDASLTELLESEVSGDEDETLALRMRRAMGKL